ncbi:MAG: hypothetical protein Tsb0016_05540 [Sphingomonadales bacterium]
MAGGQIITAQAGGALTTRAAISASTARDAANPFIFQFPATSGCLAPSVMPFAPLELLRGS